MNKRLDLLDVTKGICIILMTISHFPKIGDYKVISHLNETVFMAFKMPLFFMISGYLLNLKYDFKKFFLSKGDALIKTTLNITLLFSMFLFVKKLDVEIFVNLLHSLKDGSVFPMEVALYPLWFPIALFISLVLVRCILVVSKKENKVIAVLTAVGIYSTLFALYHYNVSFYFFNSLIFSVAFIHLGSFLRNKVDPSQLVDYCNKPVFFWLAAGVFGTLCFFSQALNIKLDIGISTGSKLEGNLILMLLKTLSGAYVVLCITLRLSRVLWLRNFLLKCAKSSFVILSFHVKVTVILFKITDMFGQHILLDLFVFSANIAICLVIFNVFSNVGFLKALFLPSYGSGVTLRLPSFANIFAFLSNSYRMFSLGNLSTKREILLKSVQSHVAKLSISESMIRKYSYGWFKVTRPLLVKSWLAVLVLTSAWLAKGIS